MLTSEYPAAVLDEPSEPPCPLQFFAEYLAHPRQRDHVICGIFDPGFGQRSAAPVIATQTTGELDAEQIAGQKFVANLQRPAEERRGALRVEQRRRLCMADHV